jgi:hypothetical protein
MLSLWQSNATPDWERVTGFGALSSKCPPAEQWQASPAHNHARLELFVRAIMDNCIGTLM